MKSFSRLVKPLTYTTLGLGVTLGGYYLYDSYRVKNSIIVPDRPLQNTQILHANVLELIQSQEHTAGTTQQRNQLKQEKQETLSKHQKQNINHQKSTLQINQVQENPSLTEQQSPIRTQAEQLQEKKQNIKPQKNSKQQKITIPIDFTNIKRLSQLNQLPSKPLLKPKTVLIVSDIGFTEQFEQKLIETIKNIQKIQNHQEIQIYRTNTMKQEVRQQFSKHYGVKINDQTIFLIKNQLDPSFINIDFEMYMQYPAAISTYMTKLNPYDSKNQQEYLKRLQKMSPNQSFLMFVYDDNEPTQKRFQQLLAAKYLQMELALHHLDSAIKVLPIEAGVIRANKIVPQQKIRANSLHIIRKHNQFTHVSPNLHLKFNDQITPYHLLADIGFHNKRGEVAIQSYLSKIQTFNSLSITTPYVISVTIDKNRITTENYKNVMDTFKELKRKNKHPQLGITLKFAEIGYLGKDQPQNPEFTIKIANIAELQNQSFMHQMQKPQDAHNTGITEDSWLRRSYQYLYPHQVISQDLISDFFKKVLLNEVPEYFRSDKPSTIQNVHKIVASSFDKEVLQNSFDHFVFEYSDHCPSCKMISPLIGYMNQILEPIPLQARFDIHKINCQKNRVKNQLYSPYTPNMNYYKNEWKHSGPVRISLETISHNGLAGLYDFCVITKTLKTIDSKKFNETIDSAKEWNKSEFIL